MSNNKTFRGGFGFPLNTFNQKSYLLVKHWAYLVAVMLYLEQETRPNDLIVWKSLIPFLAQSISRWKQQFGFKNHSDGYIVLIFHLLLCSLLRDLPITIYPEAASKFNFQLICVGFLQSTYLHEAFSSSLRDTSSASEMFPSVLYRMQTLIFWNVFPFAYSFCLSSLIIAIHCSIISFERISDVWINNYRRWVWKTHRLKKEKWMLIKTM